MTQKTPQGGSNFTFEQTTRSLQLLRDAGPRAVPKRFLTFECRFTQCAARFHELEKRGFKVRNETRPGDRCVTFVLEAEPKSPKADRLEKRGGNQGKLDGSSDWWYRLIRNNAGAKPRVDWPDWYERRTGKPRPSGKPLARTADLPLFAERGR